MNVYVKALLEALVFMILWFDYNVMPMDVVNVVMFYSVIILGATNDFSHEIIKIH